MGDYLDTTNQRYPKPGDRVRVAQKRDYASGELTSGVVEDVLTKKRYHPRGHKVRLTSGVIGRVQEFAGAPAPRLGRSDLSASRRGKRSDLKPPSLADLDFDPEHDLR